MMRLEGKIALVSGGGSGIGRGIVERFAQEGASTAVLDVNAAGAQQTADAARRMGAEAIALQADVSRSEQVQTAMRAVADRWGRLDVLVNCAGIFWAQRGDTLVTEMDEAVWDHVLAVNLKGVFLCCK